MKNFKRVLLTLVAALLVFAMCFAMVGCGKDSDKDKDDKSGSSSKVEVKKDKPEDIADKAMKSMFEDYDAQAYVDLINDDILDAAYEDSGMTEEEFVDQFQVVFDSIEEAFTAMGDDVEITWEVGKVSDVDDLDEINDSYKDIADVEIEDAKTVKVTVTAEATVDGESAKQSKDMELSVILIDGEWSLDILNFDMSQFAFT